MAQISFPISGLVLALLLVSASGEATGVKFTYSGTLGPEKWGSLSPTFYPCSSGKAQSPIDIKKNGTVHDTKLKALLRDYKPANATLVNNGYNVGVHYDGDCGMLNIANKNYRLKQMHWHSPSEHWIDGVQYPLELHLVHLAEDGAPAVVGILYDYGNADPFIAKIHKGLDKLTEETKTGVKHGNVSLGKLDDKLLRKKIQKYYRYVGSLTTPPCTENVMWNILAKVRTVSKEQVEALKVPLDKEDKKNCRPLQSLNGRKIELYNEFATIL